MSTSMLVLSMVVISISHFLVDMMLGIWPAFKSLAHIDLALAGLIGGGCALIGEGMQVFFGILSDKGYRKYIVLIGLLATTASACFVYVDNYLGIAVIYLLTCIGSGAFHPSAASIVSELPSKNKSIMIAILVSCGYLGMAFSQVIFTNAKTLLDGEVIWLAVPAVIVGAFTLACRIGKQSVIPKSSGSHFNLSVFAKFLRQPELRVLYFTQFCNQTMFWAILFLLPDLLHSRGYEDWLAFGYGHMAFVLGGALMMIPAGYLADYYSGRSVIVIGTAVSILSFYAILFFPLLDDVPVLSLLFCLGASSGLVNPLVIAMGAKMAPNHRGLISAFLMGLVWCISEPLGQISVGFLATCFESDAPAKALAILGVVFIIGEIFAFQLPKNTNEVDLNELVPIPVRAE